MVVYTYKRSARARAISLVVRAGKCTVLSPRYVPKAFVAAYVATKADWIAAKSDELLAKIPAIAPARNLHHSAKELQAYKDQALAFVQDRLTFFNAQYKFTWKRIVIKNQTTRWGSCSSTGTLSFNYKIIFLPPDQADYIVVHELCHLGEFNHSAAFWNLVERACPEYRILGKAINGRLG